MEQPRCDKIAAPTGSLAFGTNWVTAEKNDAEPGP